MVIYDKAMWHIDGGEEEDKVIARFAEAFKFLNEKNLLSEDGKEFFAYGVDDSTSLNSEMVTQEGSKFLTAYYEKALSQNPENFRENLLDAYKEFASKFK